MLKPSTIYVFWGAIISSQILAHQTVKKDLSSNSSQNLQVVPRFLSEISELFSSPVNRGPIKYYLYTRNRNRSREIDVTNPRQFTNISENARIVFLVHGWIESVTKKLWYDNLKNAFLDVNENEFYVVEVNWSIISLNLYSVVCKRVKEVGNIIGKFIVDLNANYSIPLDKFLLVGHSLGGQVIGFVGKKVIELTGKKLPRIIALDPAGPHFDFQPSEERLVKNDAEVVEILHYHKSTLGSVSSRGTLNFYVKDNFKQPGCQINLGMYPFNMAKDVMCNHHRSWSIFTKALRHPNLFMAVKCKSSDDFNKKLCDENQKLSLGDLKSTEQGDFYIKINEETSIEENVFTTVSILKT